MLVSDLVSQYQNTLNSGSKIAKKTKGVEQLSKMYSSLEKGQIFEGTVSSIKGDKVTLALSSGQTITARLDKNVDLSEGQSVFFQVKSNEGGSIQIRPISSEFGGNPTLLNALKGAGLPENETNLKLINSMMKEQMPVDRDSVRSMLNLVRSHPNSDIDTIVSLKKLGLPVNESMITQYENYKANEGEILRMVDSLTEDIPKAFNGETATKSDVLIFQNDLIGILENSGDGEVIQAKTSDSNSSLQGNITNIVGDLDDEIVNTYDPKVSDNEIPRDGARQSVIFDPNANNSSNSNFANTNILLKDFLTPETSVKLNNVLNEIPNLKQSVPQLFDANGNVRTDIKSTDLLKVVNNYFATNPSISKDAVLKFLESDPVKSLLKEAMSNKWTLEPKDLLKPGSVNSLYDDIEEDMQKIIESSKKSVHAESNPIMDSAQSVKDNLSFIREVNQIYQYVQIPLKMSGENTTGELFVYTNKKAKRAENDEITAFLHFDMENLGSTDIAVKLAGTKLDTKFFLEDDLSYNIVAQNLHILEERLTELGYNCKMTVENDSQKVDFVEDFLKQDVKTAGEIKRYSFDVRA